MLELQSLYQNVQPSHLVDDIQKLLILYNRQCQSIIIKKSQDIKIKTSKSNLLGQILLVDCSSLNQMKIRYKISSFSSENPSNPIINLVSNSGDWQSARFCTYPQQITLAFNDPVNINKIKIVAHPTKVPQKINLLYHLPTVQNQQEYTKIGYVAFKPPKQDQQPSSPQKKPLLKQLKVIKGLELKALYLRLIITQNHTCKSNFFNQVSLSCIQITGTATQLNLSQIQLKNDSLLQLNIFAQDKLYVLSQFKQKCIEREQYNQANQIKEIMRQVGELMEQIKELNEEKIRHVHEENYTQAKKVKEEINKIKQQIQYITNNFYDPSKKIINKFNIDRSARTRLNQSKQKPQHSDFDNQFMKDNQTIVDNHSQSPQAQNNDPENQHNDSYVQGFYQHQKKVVPALLNKLKKSDIKPDNDELAQSKISQTLPDEPQELSPSNEANSSILAEFYQKLTIRKLHSKHWQFKNQALQEILENAKKHANTLITKNQLKSYIFVYNRIMSKQNNKQFILAVIEIINLVTGMKVQDKDFKTDMARQLDKTIIETLEKTQDNQNLKIKMQAQKVIIRMQQSPIFGILSIYHAILKAYDDKMASKIKKIYLDTLEYIVTNIQGSLKNTLPQTIVDFTVKKLSDPSNQVRKGAINLLKSLKKHGYEDRIKICMSQQKGFKQSYLKELNLQ